MIYEAPTQVVLTTAGTAYAVSAVADTVPRLIITNNDGANPNANTGRVFVGLSGVTGKTNGQVIPVGASLTLYNVNPSKIYATSDVNAQTINVMIDR
jgi:GTP:adenosylcobinamide-phosphate guanylyltransferase